MNISIEQRLDEIFRKAFGWGVPYSDGPIIELPPEAVTVTIVETDEK